MSTATSRLQRLALSTLHFSGADRLFSGLTRGAGVIFTLHQVRPGSRGAFDPNGILRITPDFLEELVSQVIEAGFEPLSLDAAAARLSMGATTGRPFACFTFDDGYRDNAEHAYPILSRHQVPFTVYVVPDFADGRGEIWWLALEEVVRRSRELELCRDGVPRRLACRTDDERNRAFETLYWWLRRQPEDEARRLVRTLVEAAGFDLAELCRREIMSWQEVRALAADPLVTIGAHTLSHRALAHLHAAEAAREIAASMARIEHELGRPCRHFSFPYGDAASAGEREFRLAAEAGAMTAVTTRKGLIRRPHGVRLTALPRVSINGKFQRWRYVKVLLSGAPFALLDAAQAARALARA